MRKGLLTFGILLSMLLAPKAAMAAAHIDATTRNHSTNAESVLIADGGTAKLPIVISDKAGKDTKARAAELASYLERITGAKFQIKTGAGGPGILMGTIAEFPTPSAADGLRICDASIGDGREAYAIRTEGGSVKLLGGAEPGVSHAASRFLELLGCRWFFQSPVWEVVPKADKLTFNINETDRPEVLARFFGYDLTQMYEKTDPDMGGILDNWYRHNYVSQSFKPSTGHCAHNLVQRFKQEFEAHPEMRALIKDENGNLIRTGTGPESPPGHLKPGSKSWGMWGQLCVTNPRTQELAIKYVEEQFDKHPELDMVGVGPDDGGEWCLCPECAKLGNCGNQAFYLANVVAKAIQKSHPGKMVGLYAYNWHCDPPDFPLEPNIYIELATSLMVNSKYGFDKLLELWPTKVKYFGIYDYWAVYDWTRDKLPTNRTGSTRYVAEKLPYYMKHGICELGGESGNSWGGHGLGFYLASRVLWNSSADTEALKKDFYEKAFGPAAQEMKAYYEHVDLGNGPLVGPTFYRVCCDHLEAAEKAAAGRPDVLARIAQLKQYNVYVYLLGKKDNQQLKPEERKKWAFETLQWNYRIRNTYMTFWVFFSEFTSRQWANEFKEPTWDWGNQLQVAKKVELVPYRKLDAVTPEETDQWFQKMKADYGEVPKVTEVHFSRKLVAPEWSGKTPPQGTWEFPGALQGQYTLAIAGLKGEPLRLSFKQGLMYPDVTRGAYVLEDADGKEIGRGEMLRGDNKPLELKVPATGVYYLKYNDSGGGSSFACDKRLRVALVLSKGTGIAVSGNLWSSFYVPSNLKEMQFFASGGGGGALGIRDPNDVWIGAETAPVPRSDGIYIKSDGTYHVIPVKPGTDGKMWTLHYSPGQIYFFNLPTILQLTGDGPIVPEEVAKADGLKW